ncbi:MAG: DUF2200 family protein [Saprospiraceae bacterium]
MKTTIEHDERIAKMTFATVYPLYVRKVERKGRTKEECKFLKWFPLGFGIIVYQTNDCYQSLLARRYWPATNYQRKDNLYQEIKLQKVEIFSSDFSMTQ